MTVGIAGTEASALLNTLNNTSTVTAAVYVKLHTAEPGVAGATAPSAVTTRSAVTWTASSAGGALVNSNTPTWSMTTGETITHISLWTASTSGTFLWSVALTTSKTVASGDTLNLTSLSLAFSPIAA